MKNGYFRIFIMWKIGQSWATNATRSRYYFWPTNVWQHEKTVKTGEKSSKGWRNFDKKLIRQKLCFIVNFCVNLTRDFLCTIINKIHRINLLLTITNIQKRFFYKHRNFCEKSNFFLWKIDFLWKTEFVARIEIFVKNRIFCKNRNFCQK